MAPRLMTLRQIQTEKFPRSRSWIFAEIAAGRFPKPVGGCVPNLWEETVIDNFVASFIAAAKQHPADGNPRTEKATAARKQRREDRQAAA